MYQSEWFTVTNDRVTQGEYTAVAKSATEMDSDYQSPANAFYSRLVEFKFSINGKDNELPFGVNHRLILKPEDGKIVSPVIKFGQKDAETPEATAGDYLESNTEFTIRVDMSPVLEAFEKDGFYTTWNQEKIYKEDFRKLYVAGGSAPLSWDFESLRNTPEYELKDPDGDGIFETKLVMNTYNPEAFTANAWSLQNDISNYPALQTDRVLDLALYNLSLDETVMNKEDDGTFRTGAKWPGVWTRDISYSVLLAYAMIEPEYSKTSLLRKVKRNRIIQDTGSGGSWPISTDRTTWALAAWEIYKVTGDQDWLRQAYTIIKNSVADDVLVAMAPESGMMRGESSFLDWRKQSYPIWMDNVDIYISENLGTNAVHFQTYQILGWMAELLGEDASEYQHNASGIKNGMNQYLWLDKEGFYAQYRYGRNKLCTSPRSETLGEAFCILFDIADDQQQQSIIQNTPMTPYGAPCFYPQIPGIPPYHNNGIWPFVQAYWNWAAAKAGNEAALVQGLAAMNRAAAMFLTNKENFVAENGDYRDTQINSDRQLWSVAGNLAMTYRILFGMEFHADHISFSPAIPKVLGGDRSLTGFQYRKATLNISVKGYGNTITAFRIDGKESSDHKIPGNLEGEHTIEIELDNNTFDDQSFTLLPNRFSLEPPVLQFANQQVRWKAVEDATHYRVYLDGEMVSETENPVYVYPKDAKPHEISISSVDNKGYESFTSEPQWIHLDQNATVFEAEVKNTPSKSKSAGYTGKGFIELTLKENTEVEFSLDIPEKGAYFIQFRYANGSGPWNTDNKCAIRSLYKDETLLGAVVMPQRGKDEWANWAYSNGIKVNLEKGPNTFNLSMKPFNQNMNLEVNRAFVDHIRMIRLE